DDGDAWQVAQAPAGITLDNLMGRQLALANGLRQCFRQGDGTGRFCTVDAFGLGAFYCFVAYVADRAHLLDVFTEDGRHETRLVHLALPVLFVYDPGDSRIFLRARTRSMDRIQDLFDCFGKRVLGVKLGKRSLARSFRLERLTQPVKMFPDTGDM